MPTVDIYSKQQVDALIAGAGGLPDPTSASAGDVLTLDSNKDPSWAAVPDELPATTSASVGDVLTLDSNKDPSWAAPGGGGASLSTVDIINLMIAGCKIVSDIGNSIRGIFYHPSDGQYSNVICVSNAGVVTTPSTITTTFMNKSVTITFDTTNTVYSDVTFSNKSGKMDGLKYVKFYITVTIDNTSRSSSVSGLVNYYAD